MEKKEAPSLLSLCMKAAASSIPHGCDYLQDVLELPFDLLDALAMDLSPLALQTLHEISRDNYSDGIRVSDNCNQRKRGRYEIFDIAWKELYKKRWPGDLKKMEQMNGTNLDWHPLYCEAHLQECFDGAAEKALVPSFVGSIGELTLSDKIIDAIGFNPSMNDACTKLWYQCKRFGPFSKCLRLQSVLCSEEMAELMRDGKIETLIFTRIISQDQVDGACMLLNRHKETLRELQFVHSQLQPGVLNQIYDSLCINNINNNNNEEESRHKIQILKFKSSRFYENKSRGLLSFLSSGRDLKSVHFCDTKLQQASAQIILDTILHSSCELSTLEISDNYIGAWLSNLRRKYNNFTSFLPEQAISLSTISSLNLRGNYLEACDALDLSDLLQKMPNLTSLDLSDNTLTDEGLRYLIPFFKWALEKEKPLLSLNIANCFLTNKGVNELIENCVDLIKEPLNFLSLGDNHLGSSVGENLAKLMGESLVRELNIEEICLEKSGFKSLELHLPPLVSLSSLNISKNRGKNQAANFMSKLILRAPNLVSIDARSNLMPSDSLSVIYNSLKKLSRRHLARVDLSYNPKLCESELKSEIMKLEHRGHPIVIFPARSFAERDYLFDDEL
ncbi:hypothetical protein LUZ60_012229 [Juncus effusus]|nr:hypothetical protein LUZ60_012229 [Juncus effusus]